MRNLIALMLLASSLPALAQDPSSGLDEPAPATASASRRRARAGGDDVVREIVRGYYLQSSVGSTIYAPLRGVPLGGVMALGIGMGDDFIDKERFSAAWEVEIAQGLANGPGSRQAVEASGPVVQGDIHTVAGTAVVEASIYLSRRLGIGGRAGGGILYAPVLVTDDVYNQLRNEWEGQAALYHAGTLPLALVGATLEYYTKLSHFSIGANADLNVLFPATALTFRPVGYLKYTF